jgi:magnesium chelatase family protein
MAFAHCFSAQTDLLSGRIVDVEVDTSPGLYSFSIVGLPDKAVEEARDRISAAIKNSGFKSPKAKNVKVVISLAPASLKKEGSSFDLSMALSYLLSSKEVDFNNKRETKYLRKLFEEKNKTFTYPKKRGE